MENSNNLQALKAIMSKMSKDYSLDLTGTDYGDVEPLPTGSAMFDAALEIGGLPRGRVIEIFGPNSSLKTSLALSCIAENQMARKAKGITDKRDLLIDVEHSLTRSLITGCGCDMDQIIWLRLDTAEMALEVAEEYAKSGAIDYVLFDSVAAAETATQAKKDIGDATVGGISKVMHDAMRKISKVAAVTGTTYIFINQRTINPMQKFGNPATQPGGSALGFYACIRIETLGKELLSDLPGGVNIRLKIVKSKVGQGSEDIHEIRFVRGKGFDRVGDVEEMAKGLGLLRHSGGQTKVRWDPDQEEEPLLPDIAKGKEAGQKALRENPKLVERLRNACLRARGVNNARPDAEFRD